jgi:hypothetical protein
MGTECLEELGIMLFLTADCMVDYESATSLSRKTLGPHKACSTHCRFAAHQKICWVVFAKWKVVVRQIRVVVVFAVPTTVLDKQVGIGGFYSDRYRFAWAHGI